MVIDAVAAYRCRQHWPCEIAAWTVAAAGVNGVLLLAFGHATAITHAVAWIFGHLV